MWSELITLPLKYYPFMLDTLMERGETGVACEKFVTLMLYLPSFSVVKKSTLFLYCTLFWTETIPDCKSKTRCIFLQVLIYCRLIPQVLSYIPLHSKVSNSMRICVLCRGDWHRSVNVFLKCLFLDWESQEGAGIVFLSSWINTWSCLRQSWPLIHQLQHRLLGLAVVLQGLGCQGHSSPPVHLITNRLVSF